MKRLNKPSNTKFQGTRRLVRKSMLIIFMFITFVMVLVAEPGGRMVARASSVAMNVVSPVVAAVRWPFERVSGFFSGISNFRRVNRANESLVEENRVLRDRVAELEGREREMGVVLEVCRHSLAMSWDPISARVVGGGSSSFSRSFVLSVGSYHGVRMHQPVTVGGNFVGQISAVGANHSRLLLLTDSASRISVQLGHDGGRAFLFGNGTSFARLRHFERERVPGLGEIVFTSGLDENVPAEIPVGIVGAIERDGSVLVQPFVAASEIGSVSILLSRRPENLRTFLETEDAR